MQILSSARACLPALRACLPVLRAYLLSLPDLLEVKSAYQFSPKGFIRLVLAFTRATGEKVMQGARHLYSVRLGDYPALEKGSW